jgi:hypothetical protein
MKRPVETLEQRALMNSAPVLSDVVLAISDDFSQERIASIGKSGSEWVDSHLVADSPPAIDPLVADIIAANVEVTELPMLEHGSFVEEVAISKLRSSQPSRASDQPDVEVSHDLAFQATDADWLSIRYEEISADLDADQGPAAS